MNTSKAPVESCLSLGIRKANRVMSQIYDQHLADCNLRSTQYSILRVLYHRGEATGRDLRNFLVLDQSTMSRNLKPLLRDGFIVQSEGEDRREKPLKLTSKGRTLHKKAAPLWEKAQAEVKRRLGAEMSQQLLVVSDAIVALKR